MPRRSVICCSALLATLLLSPALFAQRTGGSMFSGGSTFGGSQPGGSSSFGSGSSLGGSNLGGGLGGNTIGGGRNAAGGQNLGFGNTGGANNGNFVGRNAQDVSSFFNMLNPNAGGFSGPMSRGAMNRGRGVNESENQRPPVMVGVRLGFTAPRSQPAQIAQQASTRLNGILRTNNLGDARIVVQSGQAIITGMVADQSRLLVLERLARLEPGVEQVINQATVMTELPAPPPNNLPTPQ